MSVRRLCRILRALHDLGFSKTDSMWNLIFNVVSGEWTNRTSQKYIKSLTSVVTDWLEIFPVKENEREKNKRLNRTICKWDGVLIHFTSEKEVHIVNGLPDNTHSLIIRCQSKDDDLGYHTLLVGQEFFWHFHDNLWGTTLFFCHFWWQGIMDRSFDVYDYKHKNPPCANNKEEFQACYWLVKADGFYYSNHNAEFNSSDWQKLHPWKE
ncbi:hypothetical protein LguiB_018383 [Lonicera macranthoides]